VKENTIYNMAGTLSEENRRILDALLSRFQYLCAIDITGEVKQILISQNRLTNSSPVDKYSNEIKDFLVFHDFVFIHSSDAVVNSNGMLLKSSGSLTVYEEWVRDEEERLMRNIGNNINAADNRFSDPVNAQPASWGNDYANNASFIFQVKQTVKLIKEKSDIFFRKVMDWSLA
jgi:hypothetical protein